MLRERHIKEFGVEPLVEVKVPEVVRFFGFFAELYGGRFIAGTDSKSLYISVSPRDDQICNIYNCAGSEKKHFSLPTIKFKAEDKYLNYVKAVFKYFSYLKPQGYDIMIDGEILSSGNFTQAAAIATGLTAIFDKIYNLGFSKMEIAQKAFKAVCSFCGNNCNMTDTITMAAASSDGMITHNFRTCKCSIISDIPIHEDNCMLIVSANLDTDVARDTIADLSESMKIAGENLPYGFIDMSNLEYNSAQRSIPEEFKDQVNYMHLEQRATNLAYEASVKHRPCAENRAIIKTYKQLSDNLNVFFPEYDWIIKRAMELNECRAAGLGFAGMDPIILISIKKSAVEKFSARIADFEHIFGPGLKITEYVPSEGLTFLN